MLIDFRKRVREEERRKQQCEKETSTCCLSNVPGTPCALISPHTLPTSSPHSPIRDLTCNLGMCPDWESNPKCLVYELMLYPTEPHPQGQGQPLFIELPSRPKADTGPRRVSGQSDWGMADGAAE